MWRRILGPVLAVIGIDLRKTPRRITPELTLTIEGKAYATTEWSLGGFHIANFKREISTKEKIKGQTGAVGASSGGAFTATVIRVTDDGGFGACWTDIERDVFDAMHG